MTGCLFPQHEWSEQQHAEFSELVQDMQQHWTAGTGLRSFPKLHMLTHAAEFARRFNALGRYSEAQIESYHARFNHKFKHNHRNLGAKTEPRLRRSLADLLLFSAAHARTKDATSS